MASVPSLSGHQSLRQTHRGRGLTGESWARALEGRCPERALIGKQVFKGNPSLGKQLSLPLGPQGDRGLGVRGQPGRASPGRLGSGEVCGPAPSRESRGFSKHPAVREGPRTCQETMNSEMATAKAQGQGPGPRIRVCAGGMMIQSRSLSPVL